MSTNSFDLTEAARIIEAAGSSGRDWLRRRVKLADGKLTGQSDRIMATTYLVESLARKCRASSSGRSAVCVFGASQVGKSYLVSCLGQSRDQPFTVKLANQRYNFLRDINPSRLKEATGVVTRFTTEAPRGSVSHPVELKLLGETDIAKILGNTFLADFDQHKRVIGLASVADIRASISRLESRALTESATTLLDEVDMFDVGQYFRDRFRTSIGALSEAGYWDALVRFGHRLPDDTRAELFGLLWGSTQDLTQLFLHLTRQLRKLGNPVQALAHISALVPRERSVIDVNTLIEGLATDKEVSETVELQPLNPGGLPMGAPTRVPRATLTALVSELRLSIEHVPWGFLSHTDLLDFPGARTREAAIDFPTAPEVRGDFLRNMFLRGKVAYLFQQFTEALEVPAMLLCVAPSNQEVKYTGEITSWVNATHGDDATKRSRLPCSLFTVLTKVDMMLAQQAGDSDDSLRERVESRLSGVNSLFAQEPWLRDWNGHPLGNFHFLRNPFHHAQRDVFEIEGSGDEPGAWRETGLTPIGARRSELVLEGMMRSEQCQQHFGDRESAWLAAVTPGDGGVLRLVASLERVLSADLKSRQIMRRLADQAHALDASFRPFYRSADKVARERKRAMLSDLLGRLFQACKDEFRNFAALQSQMMVAEANARPVFSEVATLKLEAATVSLDPPGLALNPWGSRATARLVGAPPDNSVKSRDRFDHFALALFSAWEVKMRELSVDAARQQSLGMLSTDEPHDGISLVPTLVNEILEGARRLDLSGRLARKLRDRLDSANVRWDQISDRVVTIALIHFNDFIATLGFAERPESERPVSPYGNGTIFQLPKPPDGSSAPSLGDVPANLALQRFLDWGTAFLELGLENVSDESGSEEDRRDNRALGDVLQSISPYLESGGS